MAKPTSPSPPHSSRDHPKRHVDIRGKDEKIHVDVKNNLGATAIGGYQRFEARKDKGRS
jgi:hypothetical protein